MNRIGIVGAGAWGTALATAARRAGRRVVLWCRRPDLAETINRIHRNDARLPGVDLDPGIVASADLAAAIDADLVLLAVPAQHGRAVSAAAAKAWRPGVPVVLCAKGIEQTTGALMGEVVAETLPGVPLAVLSGPSFAAEVARQLPTAVTLAAADPALAGRIAATLGTPAFRIYTTDDVIGAELGGAVKNVLAIACGIVQGKGLGDNARAALITRGLAEMTRLALSKGARPETLMGLSGLGDLVLTCGALQSRNFSFGIAVGEGGRPADVLARQSSVVEGALSAAAVVQLAGDLRVDMPIARAVDTVVNRAADLDATITGLLARPFRTEDPRTG